MRTVFYGNHSVGPGGKENDTCDGCTESVDPLFFLIPREETMAWHAREMEVGVWTSRIRISTDVDDRIGDRGVILEVHCITPSSLLISSIQMVFRRTTIQFSSLIIR